ncbi:MAG TPA: glycosyltransferase 87 family protein [Actinomycetota bacterium]|nr:glycosyltransferase 87 family protein [Actinomycetota bacterium]
MDDAPHPPPDEQPLDRAASDEPRPGAGMPDEPRPDLAVPDEPRPDLGMPEPPSERPPGRDTRRPPREIWLGTVLIAVAVSCLLGLWLKAQPDPFHGWKADCANGVWTGNQYSYLCYSDIVPLLGTEHLDGGRLPYLDRCPGTGECDEYPVVTMWAMRLAAWMSGSYGAFFYANALLLAIAAGVTAVCLYLVAGRRALWFALAPTLVVYGFMNWDLIAVAFAVAGILAFFRGRDVWAGVLFGLGAAAKLFPALLVIPFAAERFRRREPDRGIHLAWAAAGTWVAVNLPFALLGFHGWWEFFRFNATRQADFDSLWYIGCHMAGGSDCVPTSVVNLSALVAFAVLTGVVWAIRRRRQPSFPTWTVAFPAVVLFLATNKVYSPQYGLWLLPLFALALPDLGRLRAIWLFVAFEITDVAVFVTRFTWFNVVQYGGGGAPFWAFETAVLARMAVLILCLIAWVTGPPVDLDGPALQDEPALREPRLAVGAPA